ncbi:MAG: transposase [Anaerolineae bacterium]|nr:transposase [Anaerolineae bacterium]
MSQFDYKLFYKRSLPHQQPAGAALFVTSRLVGSLPAPVVAQLRIEAHRLEMALGEVNVGDERDNTAYSYQRQLFGKWDTALDTSGTGPRWLSDGTVAGLVADSIRYRDGSVYDLLAFCIMPNHMHLVFTPLNDDDGHPYGLSKIMQSLKGYTARECNRILGRQGGFWRHESYDHWVRDEAECERIVRYVTANPVKAGLVGHWEDWPWTYVRDVP